MFKRLMSVAIIITVVMTGAAMAASGTATPFSVRWSGDTPDLEGSQVISGRNLTTMERFLADVVDPDRWSGLKDLVARRASEAIVAAGDWLPGELVWIEIPALVVNGRLHLPLGLLADALDGDAVWDEKQQMVVIGFRSEPRPPAQPPGSVRDLTYTILRTDRDLYLVVTNPTRRSVTMRFPSSQTHDFLLVDERGRTVWRYSKDRSYAQAVRVETLAAGESRVYQATIPEQIPGGNYTVRALFPPAGPSQVAAARIELEGRNEARELTFDLSFRPASAGFGQTNNRLAFQVMNRTGRDLTIRYPGNIAFRLVINNSEGREVWRYEGRNWSGRATEVVPASSSRFNAVTAPNLPAGRYTATAVFLPAGERPVATTSFTVR